MRWLPWLILPLALFAGCNRVSEEDLGNILDELPKVTDEPYDMSDELGPPLPPEEES